MPRVNADILVWARETAGLTLEAAAAKLNISSDRLALMESGEIAPTRRQLTVMASKYRRSLLVFYMAKPPADVSPDKDFRTARDADDPAREALVATMLREIHARQELVSEAISETENPIEFKYVGSASIDQPAITTAEQISQTLSFSREDFREQRNPTEAFAALRASVEELGIFVVLMGNLGTHHTNVDASTFRGFAITDKFAPVVVINETDSRSAWSFTLIHELAHIWLGETGISGYAGELRIERYCDEVAAHFFIDQTELTKLAQTFDIKKLSDPELVGELASDWNVSRTMVAYNFLRAGLIDRQNYRDLAQTFEDERKNAEEERVRAGNPDYYVVRKHRVGPGLTKVVRQLFSEGLLNASRAARVLGVKPTAVTRMVGISGQA